MSTHSDHGASAGQGASLDPVLLHTLEGHQGAIYDLVLTEDGDLVSAGGDGLLVRWPKTDRGWSTEGTAVAKAAAPLFAACTAATGLLAGTGDGGVVAVTADNEWQIKPAHPGGTYVVTPGATGGADGLWRTWPEGEVVAQVKGRIRCSLSVDQGTYLGTSEGTIHHLPSGATMAAHDGAVRALMLWPGKEALASVGGDGRLRIWKSEPDGALSAVLSVDAHKGAVYRMAISPDRRWVATCSRDKSIAVWNSDTLALEARIARPQWKAHSRSINAMVWSDNGTLATAGDGGRILIWSLASREAPAAL